MTVGQSVTAYPKVYLLGQWRIRSPKMTGVNAVCVRRLRSNL